jgi:hypothetical protein
MGAAPWGEKRRKAKPDPTMKLSRRVTIGFEGGVKV